MRTIIYETYGAPDVLQLQKMDKPIANDDEVLIKVNAGSINALDWHLMRGKPFMARIGRGYISPKKKRLGADFAGIIEATGKNVREYKTGDAVFGDTYPDPYALSEYIVMNKNAVFTRKPQNLTFEEAAAIPAAGVTALQALCDHGEIKSGHDVLINGASGAVGTFTVQIAKAFGANIHAVCSTRNISMVQKLGASKVIDYTKDDFTQNGKQYDLVVDNVGNRSVRDLKRVLKQTGRCVIVGFTNLSLLLQHAMLASFIPGNGKIILMGSAKPNKKDLNTLKEMSENEKIKPEIEKTYSLIETSEAMRYLETGHARAKIVITLV